MITYDWHELFTVRGGGKGPEYEYGDYSCRVYVKLSPGGTAIVLGQLSFNCYD